MLERVLGASYRTSLVGIGAAMAALGNAITAQFDADDTTVPQWGLVVSLIIAGVGLTIARDNKVSSEKAGAR